MEMNHRDDIQKEVEKTLESLNGLERAETAPFFYTRLMARLEKPEQTVWSRWMIWLAKPAVSMSILFLFLLLNGFLLFNLFTNADDPAGPGSEYVAQQITYFDNNTP